MGDILYELDGHVATITLNRPEKLNAFTRAMAAELVALIERIDRDDTVRAAIITGAGRAFSAGADLAAGDSSFRRTAGPAPQADGPIDFADESVRDFGGYLTLRLFDCLKPVIVAFNGVTAGMCSGGASTTMKTARIATVPSFMKVLR